MAISRASDIRLRTLRPDDRDFVLWLALAWRWTQDRPWAYPETGGHFGLSLYLERAERFDQKNVGIFEGDSMLSLITIEAEPNRHYLMHVTSPRGADAALIAEAAAFVVEGLFTDLQAQRVYTLSPIFQGRRPHRGSQLLCRMCGGAPTEYRKTDEYGNMWMEYQLLRADWLQQQGKAA